MTSVDNDFSMVESDYDNDDSFMMIDEENMAPVAKKPAAKGKKAASKKNSVLSPRNDNVSNATAKTTAKGKKTKTIEETYQKKSQLEHILLRPDTYIGSTEPLETPMFIYDSEQDAIVNKTITYTPGLYKIFDESKYTLYRLYDTSHRN